MFSKGVAGRHSPCDCFSSRDTSVSVVKKKLLKPNVEEREMVHEPWVLYRYTAEKAVSRESTLFGNETKYVFDVPKVDEHWVEECSSSIYEDSSFYQDDADSGCRYSSDCDNSTITCKSFVALKPERKKANKPFHGDLITRWINQLETVEEVDTDFHSPSSTVRHHFFLNCVAPFES